MQQVRPSRTKRSARWPNLCCRKQKMEAMHPRAASLLSGRVRRIRIKPRKNSLYPLKRHRPLHRKSRQYPRLHRRINLLPHPHRHLHRNRQRNRGSNLRLSPNLPLRLSLPPAEAIRAGNEYAKVQCGVTIDTDLTAENASYFPGTADSVAWLAANGGQEALNRAVRGNVDATFQYLAAMDSADAVRAYARFNCTVRYSAASDEYIVVVLYG